MKQNYFQFKQFKVYQAQTAMKVCTDSCILGAWASPQKARNILDIGTGTGLLSLMLAQRTTAAITAIEIDALAYEEAKNNVLASPWAAQIAVEHISLQDLVRQESGQSYEYVICNPPFFKNHLLAASPQKNLALHSHALSMPELLESVAYLLSPTGRFVVMYPLYESNLLATQAAHFGLFCHHHFAIYQQATDKQAFRVIQEFGKEPCPQARQSQLLIWDSNRQYHPDFRALLQPYYLVF